MDHPDITHALQTGEPKQEEYEPQTCPVCHEQSEILYENRDGKIVGCSECLTRKFIV